MSHAVQLTARDRRLLQMVATYRTVTITQLRRRFLPRQGRAVLAMPASNSWRRPTTCRPSGSGRSVASALEKCSSRSDDRDGSWWRPCMDLATDVPVSPDTRRRHR